MSDLRGRVAAALLADAADVAARWCERAPVVAGVATLTGAEQYRDVESGIAELIRAVARSLESSAHAVSDLAWAGWRVGRMRFDANAALHVLLHELHLVEAMVLHAAERALETDEGVGTVREGLGVARALQSAMSLASVAAVRGYTHAHVERQQHRFRTLRHDLRNPLGTIRNAIALLEDETIPTHLRDPDRFRAIVSRNAQQADAMVTRDLGETAVLEAELEQQDVAVGDVAMAVRRALREAAAAAHAEIVVGDGLPVVRTDAASLELVLLASVGAALDAAPSAGAEPHRIAIEPDAVRDRSVRIRISGEHGRIPEATDIAHARDLARWAGGELSIPDAMVVELPTSPRETSDDLAGAGER